MAKRVVFNSVVFTDFMHKWSIEEMEDHKIHKRATNYRALSAKEPLKLRTPGRATETKYQVYGR